MNQNFYEGIKNILTTARNKVYQTANFAMVEAYWNIGKSIIEEQGGNEKAEYGTGLLKELSKQMTQDFGKGFTVANLKNMRQFYLTFPNGYALRSELSWTHYRLLMRVENENAREFYMQEAVKSQWSTRQLERQINSFFYERLLSSKNKEQVAAEIQTLEPAKKPEDIIATLTALTAKSIAVSYERFVYTHSSIDEVILGGGGAYNPTLVNMLRKYLPKHIELKTHEDYGISNNFKEVMAFALLGYCTYYNIPNNLPSCTGAKRRTVLGKITY